MQIKQQDLNTDNLAKIITEQYINIDPNVIVHAIEEGAKRGMTITEIANDFGVRII